MKTNENIKDRIVTLHAQNMNGRETPDEAFAKGVEACLEELNEELDKSVGLLRDLADLQNGPPLERHKDEWEKTMERVYAFLNRWEED